MTLRRVETVDRSDRGDQGLALGYSAPVRVTVAGALPRTDVGVHPVTEDNFDGHDTAIKGAVTDGMKRAFRSFGLTIREWLSTETSPSPTARAQPQSRRRFRRRPAATARPARPRPQGQAKSREEAQAEKLRKRLMELCAKQGFDDANRYRPPVQRQTGKSIDDLTVDELGSLIEAAANKLNQMRQPQAA